MKLFSITAQVVLYHDGSISHQVPAFLLSDRQVQDEAHARRIVDPLGLADEVHVCAVALGEVVD